MKKFNLIMIIILTAIFLFLYAFFKNVPSGPVTNVKTEPSPTQGFGLKKPEIIGWAAYWDEENTIRSLPQSLNNITIFSPSFYRIMPNGSLGRTQVSTREEILNTARAQDKPVVPVIGDDFDFNRVRLLLYNQRIQNRFGDQLVLEAKRENFIGWNIGIESVRRGDKQAFSNFVKNISEKLQVNGLKSYITVFGKDENEEFDAALAHDYEQIGMYADKVILMTYGFSNEGTDPGGQTPLNWYRSVLKYTLRTIPMHKIVIGLSTHGYDWKEDESEGLTFPQINERVDSNSAKVTYDKNQSSAKTTYQEGEIKHEIWFENSRTMKEKMEIAEKEFGISKFAIWRLGAEDPTTWKALEDFPNI